MTTELPAFLYRAKRGDETKAPVPLCGIAAGEPLYIGSVEDISCVQRMRWLEQMRGFGQSLS